MKHKHHIIPKHAGGTNNPSNIIKLTLEEHIEAYKQLYEEYENEYDRLAYDTLNRMSKNHNSKPMLGKIHSKETKDKISEGNSGKIPWNKGRKNVYSKETKIKMSNSAKNRKNNE